MTPYNIAFYAVSYLVIPLWLMMILLPKWHITRKVMSPVYIVLPFLLPYAILVLPHFQDILLFLIPTPAKIENLLTHPYSDVLAWIHFIPVDLFAGRWIYLDSRRLDFPVLPMVPIMTLCLLLPPLGISLYLIYRLLSQKSAADPAL